MTTPHAHPTLPQLDSLYVARWVSSDGVTNWKDETPPLLAADDGEDRHVMDIDLSQQVQTIDGFGGCFNERGWESLDALPLDN